MYHVDFRRGVLIALRNNSSSTRNHGSFPHLRKLLRSDSLPPPWRSPLADDCFRCYTHSSRPTRQMEASPASGNKYNIPYRGVHRVPVCIRQGKSPQCHTGTVCCTLVLRTHLIRSAHPHKVLSPKVLSMHQTQKKISMRDHTCMTCG